MVADTLIYRLMDGYHFASTHYAYLRDSAYYRQSRLWIAHRNTCQEEVSGVFRMLPAKHDVGLQGAYGYTFNLQSGYDSIT